MKVVTGRRQLTSHESIDWGVWMCCLLLLMKDEEGGCVRGRERVRVCMCVDASVSRWRRRSEAVCESVSR